MANKKYLQPEPGGGISETLDGLGIGFFNADAGGRFTSLSTAAAESLGAPAGEILGKVTVQDVSADPDFWPNLLRATANGASVHTLVSPVRRKDGSQFWAEWSMRRKVVSAEAPAAYEGVFRDVTMQVEDSRNQRHLLEQLSETNTHLQTFSRVQEELLSTLGHDLKTPPGIVLGFCELLLRGRYGEVRPEQTRALRAIHRNTAQLTEMLELLLVFSRFLKKTCFLSVPPYPIEPVLRAFLADKAQRNRWKRSRFQIASFAGTAVTVAPQEVLSYLLHYLLDNLEILLHPEEVCSISASSSGTKSRLVFLVPRQEEDRPPLNRLLSNIFVQPPPQEESEGEHRPYRLGLAAARYLALMVGAKLSVATFGEEGVELTLTFPTAPGAEANGGS